MPTERVFEQGIIISPQAVTITPYTVEQQRDFLIDFFSCDYAAKSRASLYAFVQNCPTGQSKPIMKNNNDSLLPCPLTMSEGPSMNIRNRNGIVDFAPKIMTIISYAARTKSLIIENILSNYYMLSHWIKRHFDDLSPKRTLFTIICRFHKAPWSWIESINNCNTRSIHTPLELHSLINQYWPLTKSTELFSNRSTAETIIPFSLSFYLSVDTLSSWNLTGISLA